MSKKDEIKKIYNLVKNCKKCNLHKKRNKIVFGQGSLNAKIMFIGEAPGYYEDIHGRPFVGRAGKILNELLDSVELKRNNIYIANVLICRPPENRKPLKNEIIKCKNYLDKQIEIIRPRIFVPMGNFASSYIFKKFGLKTNNIGNIHGRIYQIKTNNENNIIIPIYHPAYAIYNNTIKKILFKDIKLIKKVITK